MEAAGTMRNHCIVLQPDNQKAQSQPPYWTRSAKKNKSSVHGLPQTSTQNIRYESPTSIPSLFCNFRSHPSGLKVPYSWSGTGETVRRCIPDRKMTVEMPTNLVGEIKKYQQAFRRETVDEDEFVICDSPEIKNEETSPSTFSSSDPRTLPSIYAQDNALLTSLGHNPKKCEGIIVPVNTDDICVFHIQQSRLRSNCPILAPLASFFITPEMTISCLKSIIEVREHKESQATAKVLLQDHETQDIVPVTVTTDPLISEHKNIIYSRNQYVSWVTCIEKAVHSYIVAKCNQIETRPPETAPALHERTCDDDVVHLSLASIQQEEPQHSETEYFKGDKKTIFDHGDADLAYKLFPSVAEENPNKTLTKLKHLNERSIKHLQEHVRRKRPAVIGTNFSYGGAFAMPINGLKPGHLYGILGEGSDVTGKNRKTGIFIYDPYGEQHEEIQKLEIDENNRVSADFTKGCLLFEPYDTLGSRFAVATLY